MNKKIIGIEVSGEVYPIKDEETSEKAQTLETKIVNINDNLSKKASGIYSTDEVICGTWINGKPLYRKVIIDNNMYSSSFSIDTNVDMSKCVKMDVLGQYNSVKNSIFNGSLYFNPDSWIAIWSSGNKIQVDMAGYSIYKITAIIEYTKE